MLLSCDPGKDNFAYAQFELDGTIRRIGMLKKSLKDFEADSIKKLRIELSKIQKNCDKLVIERFIPRSMHKGNIGEISNIQIGILLGKSRFATTLFINASRWKTFYNRHKLWVENDSVPEHILDAIFIGLWYLYQNEYIDLAKFKKRLRLIKKKDFKYYRYKGQWYYGNRRDLHHRGRRNSFGR